MERPHESHLNKDKSQFSIIGSQISEEVSKKLSQVREVVFFVLAPEAKDVYLLWQFDRAHAQTFHMEKAEKGFWKTKINSPPGLYEYTFSLDGLWTHDIPGGVVVNDMWLQDIPAAPRVSNSIGSKNCSIMIM